MSDPSTVPPAWLAEWMNVREIVLWGAADLRDFPTPTDDRGEGFPLALSWAVPMDPLIMAGIRNGPTPAYAEEYSRVNERIDGMSAALAGELAARGFRSRPLAASDRTDPWASGAISPQDRGDKGGAGLDRPSLPAGHAAVRAMGPAGNRFYGHGGSLRSAGGEILLRPLHPVRGRLPREGAERRRVGFRDRRGRGCWTPGHATGGKRTTTARYHNGHNCGICAAVCPYGLKTLR